MKKIKHYQIVTFFALTFLLMFLSCNKKETVRKYTEKEKVIESNLKTTSNHNFSNTSTSPGNFTWDIPKGWTKIKNSSKIRLATFEINGNNNKSLCTIIKLQGDAGGLKANIERWLVQISKSPDKIKSNSTILFNQKKEIESTGGYKGFLLDFNQVIDDSNAPSILVAVLNVDSNSIFIKLTGIKTNLSKRLDEFKTFCLSFKKGKE